MKKVLALALALVMALSMSAMAFAAGTPSDATTAPATTVKSETNTCRCGAKFASEAEYNKHLALCEIKTCTKCGESFANEAEYNKHVAACTVGDEKDYVNLTVKDILEMIIDLAKSSMSQWDNIESVITALVDFVENMGGLVASEADVNGAIAQLESFNIPGAEDLINALKAKIKAMYAGETATTVVETTAAAPADTGSASVGIAVFAAVSVAAAAAYVCTKKD